MGKEMEFRCFVNECLNDPQFDWTFNEQHTFSCGEHQIHDLSTFIRREEISRVRKIILKSKKEPTKTFPKIYLLILSIFLSFCWFLLSHHLSMKSVFHELSELRRNSESNLKCSESLKDLEEQLIKLTGKVKKSKPSLAKPLKSPSPGKSNLLIASPVDDSSKLEAIEGLNNAKNSLETKTNFLVKGIGLIFDDRQSEVLSISFYSNSEVLLFGTMAGSIYSVNLTEGVIEKLYSGKHRIYNIIDLKYDDAVLVTGNSNMQEINFKLKVNQKNVPAHANWILSTRLSHDGSFLVTGSCDKLVKIWNFPKYSLKATLQGHSADVWSLDISSNNSLLVTSDEIGQIIIWDLPSQKILKKLKSSNSAIYSVLFNTQATKIFTGSGDGKITIWDLSIDSYKTLSHPGLVRSLYLSSDNKKLLSVSGKSLKVWDLETFEESKEMLHAGDLKSLQVSNDGKVAVTGDNFNRVWLWEIESGRLIWVFGGNQKNIKSVVLIDEMHVAVEEPGLLRIWDIKSLALKQVIRGDDEIQEWKNGLV
jgi:WD40 repeat protein